MSAPKRIQRKQAKGSRMPEGAIYVGRPSRWGNPFMPAVWGLDRSLALYANTVRGIWSPSVLDDVTDSQHFDDAYAAHQRFMRRHFGHPTEVARSELAGRDLACWCPLDQPCHADVLLELANASEVSR